MMSLRACFKARADQLKAQVMSAREMDTLSFTRLIVYPLGKLIIGFLADGCNIARFMSAGLLLSTVENFARGFNPSYTGFLVRGG